MEGRRNALRHKGGAVEVDDVGNECSKVAALHRELLGGRNTASKLISREIGQLRGRMPPRPDVHFCTEKFRRFKLQEQFFVLDDLVYHPGTTLSVIGIIAANDFIFVVAACGVCMAFRHAKNGSITPYRRDGQTWYFNNVDECVERVFYNKINDSIIIVSVRRRRNAYRTRALPLESIRRCNYTDNGVQIFGVSSDIPDFYNDSNIAVVPYRTSVNNVHEMSTYNLVHSFRNKNVLFARPRPGILIVAYTLTETYHITIEVLSTENWAVLKKVNYAMPPSGFDLVCISQDNILLKEAGKRTIQMICIWNDDSVNLIKQTKHQKLVAIYDLTAKRFLLRFKKNIVVASCNSHDEQVALLKDNEVPGNYSDNMSDAYLTRDNNHVMIYSRKHIEKPREGINIRQEFSCIGSINICNTFNGESVWKINPCDDVDLAIARRMEGDNNMTNIHTIIREALQDVTTLFYDEERHRIYTANKRGFFHVWSN